MCNVVKGVHYWCRVLIVHKQEASVASRKRASESEQARHNKKKFVFSVEFDFFARSSTVYMYFTVFT